MQCTKAIIPVAGFGTRRLPITKAIEKCMLPILDRPVIDYVVEDCIKSGVTNIYFVVSPGSTQLQEYYGHNQALENYLRRAGKDEQLPLVTPPQDVRFHFIEQDTSVDAKLGTTIPVWLCREFVNPGEHVLVLMGDDFIYNQDGSSELTSLLEIVEQQGTGSAMLGVAVPKENVSRYGVIASHEEVGVQVFDHIQEKPTIEEARSNRINVSKYLLEASFFEYLDRAVQQESTAEYFITDPLNAYVEAGNRLYVVPAKGEYLDSGTVEHWLRANQYVAEHPVRHG